MKQVQRHLISSSGVTRVFVPISARPVALTPAMGGMMNLHLEVDDSPGVNDQQEVEFTLIRDGMFLHEEGFVYALTYYEVPHPEMGNVTPIYLYERKRG